MSQSEVEAANTTTLITRKRRRSTRFCAPFEPPEVSFFELRKNREDSQMSLIIVEPNRTW